MESPASSDRSLGVLGCVARWRPRASALQGAKWTEAGGESFLGSSAWAPRAVWRPDPSGKP